MPWNIPKCLFDMLAEKSHMKTNRKWKRAHPPFSAVFVNFNQSKSNIIIIKHISRRHSAWLLVICHWFWGLFKHELNHERYSKQTFKLGFLYCVSQGFVGFTYECIYNVALYIWNILLLFMYTGWPTKNGTVDTVNFQDFALINIYLFSPCWIEHLFLIIIM